MDRFSGLRVRLFILVSLAVLPTFGMAVYIDSEADRLVLLGILAVSILLFTWQVAVALNGMAAELQERKEDLQKEIDERNRKEETLREREKHNRRIIESIAEGVWTIDAENKTDYINERGAVA